MNHHDINCPYCDAEIDVDHDCGDPNDRYEDECPECGKAFTYLVQVSFSYEAFKADCLNGGNHDFRAITTNPRELTEMACRMCDKRRKPTEEEMAEIMKK